MRFLNSIFRALVRTAQFLWWIFTRWLFAFALGCFVGMAAIVYRYNPHLFRLRPTVVVPTPPSPQPPQRVAVDLLAQEWNLNDSNVPWAPMLLLGQLSEDAYKEDELLEIAIAAPGFTKVTTISEGPMFAFVASNDKVITVAFRGTNQDEIDDWLADARITSDDVGEGSMHRGFKRATDSILAKVLDGVAEHGGNTKRIWVTGHSLGGAMALVFAFDCIKSEKLKLTGVVTFGQPMVADAKLARFLEKNLSGKYLRFVHGGDIVPCVFPTFSHCGNLVWFTEEGFRFERPVTLFSAKNTAQQTEPPLQYRAGPAPLSEEQFRELQKQMSSRSKKRLRNREPQKMEALSAPAFLQDHMMSGYLHWLTTYLEKAKSKPALP